MCYNVLENRRKTPLIFFLIYRSIDCISSFKCYHIYYCKGYEFVVSRNHRKNVNNTNNTYTIYKSNLSIIMYTTVCIRNTNLNKLSLFFFSTALPMTSILQYIRCYTKDFTSKMTGVKLNDIYSLISVSKSTRGLSFLQIKWNATFFSKIPIDKERKI